MERPSLEAVSFPGLERPEELAEAGAALSARRSPGEVAREAVAQARRLLRADAAVLPRQRPRGTVHAGDAAGRLCPNGPALG